MKEAQKYLSEKSDLYNKFLAEKDRSVVLQQESSKLEAQHAIAIREASTQANELEKLRNTERILREELLIIRTASESSTNTQNQEMIA